MSNVVSVRLSDREIERIEAYRLLDDTNDLMAIASRNQTIRYLLNVALTAVEKPEEVKEEISNA